MQHRLEAMQYEGEVILLIGIQAGSAPLRHLPQRHRKCGMIRAVVIGSLCGNSQTFGLAVELVGIVQRFKVNNDLCRTVRQRLCLLVGLVINRNIRQRSRVSTDIPGLIRTLTLNTRPAPRPLRLMALLPDASIIHGSSRSKMVDRPTTGGEQTRVPWFFWPRRALDIAQSNYPEPQRHHVSWPPGGYV